MICFMLLKHGTKKQYILGKILEKKHTRIYNVITLLKLIGDFFIMANKKPLNVEIKKINKTNIYQLFLLGKEMSKQELASELQLCIPTVAKNIDELMSAGLIKPTGSKGNTGGRNATAYSIISNAKTALGIEVTNNHITIAALDLLGNIILSEKYHTTFSDTPDYYCELGRLVNELVSKAGLQEQNILGVGIGLPVLVDSNRQKIVFNKIINLGSNVFEKLSEYIPYRIELFNDANAAAYTEIWKNPTMKNAFYLMLSNNIGGCFVLDNIVYIGDTQKAGEVGHITLMPNGQKCYCGQNGCVETYLAATNLSNLTDGNLQNFFLELERGDKSLAMIWDKYLDYLALTVNTVHTLLDCNIVLGGYVGGYIEPYMDTLRNRVERLNSFGDRANYLKTCKYKKAAIASGAALNFIAAFNESI